MEKKKLDETIKELNELSELGELKLDRMKELAKILVQHYMGKDGESIRPDPWNGKHE